LISTLYFFREPLHSVQYRQLMKACIAYVFIYMDLCIMAILTTLKNLANIRGW